MAQKHPKMDQKPDLDPLHRPSRGYPQSPPNRSSSKTCEISLPQFWLVTILHEKMTQKDDGIPIQNPSQNDGAHRCPDSGYGRLHDRDIVATARCVFSPRVADAPELPAKEIV